METQAPYRKEVTTLRKLAESPMFARGWFAKVADEQESGPFVVPLKMFIHRFGSENHPDLDMERTAYFNEEKTVVLLVTGYTNLPVITLLNWTAALSYTDSRVFG